MLSQKTVLIFFGCLILAISIGTFLFYYKKEHFELKQEVLYARETWIKPKVLFHGSVNRTIDEFKPRSIGVRHPKEGSVIFATPHIEYAATFMKPSHWSDVLCKIGSFGDGPIYFICSNKEKFLKEDRGGAIYCLPSESFYFDLYFDKISKKQWLTMKNHEDFGPLRDWVSKKAVKPLFKFEFASTFKTMIDLGVQVFFVDDATWKIVDAAQKNRQDRSAFRKVVMTLVSENKKSGINYEPLFDYEAYKAYLNEQHNL